MSSILVNIFTPQELNHSSYIQTGLFELEKESFLKTKVKLSFAKRLGTIKIDDKNVTETHQPHPKTSFYELVDLDSGKKITFATDLYDASFSFSKYALENCDYVFKRNFETKNINRLPEEYQQKIYPLGLSFKVSSSFKKSSYKFLFGIFITNLFINIKFDGYFWSRLKSTFKNQRQHWLQSKKNNKLNAFEKSESTNGDSVLFQTRCFPNEDNLDVQQIHEQRYRLVVLLKEHLKEQFQGGIISSKIANEKYKEALTNLPTDPVSYLNLIKKAKIVIYTRGLLQSPAWKMAEYLSQGKIIVAEKLTTELPTPLRDGEEVLYFTNDEELLEKIDIAIDDEALCQKLSINARKYFEKNVHPAQNVKRMITFMLNQVNECKR